MGLYQVVFPKPFLVPICLYRTVVGDPCGKGSLEMAREAILADIFDKEMNSFFNKQ